MSHTNPFILNLKANNMMSKGLLCHLVSINDLNRDIPSIDLVPVVNEFLDVFPDDLPGVPPPLERLTLVSNQNPILNQFKFLLREWLQLNSKS